MNIERNWTILFIGGASGTGKSSIAYELGRQYKVNVLEVDDIVEALKAMTNSENCPALHYWSTGIHWMDLGVSENVQWLKDVSREVIPGIKAIVENHLESDIPVIIEGDFIYPELVASYSSPKIKGVYIDERDTNQIIQNYYAREGGELQQFRAEISVEYGEWLVDTCTKLGIRVVEARPWKTGIDRILDCIS